MIDFLKESKFSIGSVIKNAIKVLQQHYFSIAGLCFLMFIVWNASDILAIYLAELHIGLNIAMLALFVSLYFGLQLTLFKYILQLLRSSNETNVSIKEATPTRKQVLYFFLGAFYFLACVILAYVLIAVLFFPLIYTALGTELIIRIASSLGLVAVMVTWIRVSFFPFFIIDKNCTPFKSLRFSLAITRGNFIQLVLLLSFFAVFHFLSLYFSYQDNTVLSILVSLINSFLIVPLSSVAIAIAYREMIDGYQGTTNPNIIHNLL